MITAHRVLWSPNSQFNWVGLNVITKNSTQQTKQSPICCGAWNSEHVQNFTTDRKLAIFCPVESSWVFKIKWSHRPTQLNSTQLVSWATIVPDALWSLNNQLSWDGSGDVITALQSNRWWAKNLWRSYSSAPETKSCFTSIFRSHKKYLRCYV